eukprot:1807380-Ditylum_brightwellii.AAC.1
MTIQLSMDELQQSQCDALDLEQPNYAPAMEVEPKSSDSEYHPDDANADRNKDGLDTNKQDGDNKRKEDDQSMAVILDSYDHSLNASMEEGPVPNLLNGTQQVGGKQKWHTLTSLMHHKMPFHCVQHTINHLP